MTPAIERYSGRFPHIADPLMRGAYLLGVELSARFYPPGTADWDQKAGQVALNEETAEFLYSSFTPLTLRYQRGTRPVLERIVERIAPSAMIERERVFAILQYCHHGFLTEYPKHLPPYTIYLNAKEEEVLQSGGGQCEDRSRLIICLCQVAGFPARLVAAYGRWDPERNYALVGGHAIIEVYLEGGWAFFDSLKDFYCLREDGRIASLWDLLRRPDLVGNQPDAVYSHCGRGREWFARYRDQYLDRRQVITLANYAVWDSGRYDWKPVCVRYAPDDPEEVALQRFMAERKAQLLAEMGLPRPAEKAAP